MFVCIAIYRLVCIAPLAKPRTSRLEQQGELDERLLGLRGLFLLHRAYLPRTLCNIRLNKLSTLSLRDIPPLKPFKRREHSTDIHGGNYKFAPAEVTLTSKTSTPYKKKGNIP